MRGKLLAAVAVIAALIVGTVGGTVARDIARPTTALAADSLPATGPSEIPPPIRDVPLTKAQVAAGPCDDNTAAQRVIVSIAAQHMWLCDRTTKVYETAVTTGMAGKDTRTPTGQFTIEQKLRDQILDPQTGELYPVKYWIAFDAPAYGFHDSDWQTIPYGSAKYTTGGSHGCVHVPLTGIKKLWSWVHVGAKVTIA